MRHRSPLAKASLILLLVGWMASCASVQFDREDTTTGTFTSSALSFTFLSFDLPSPALSIARANASDSRLNELVIENEIVFPYFWRLDWILDILSVRYARVSGTWGVPVSADSGVD